MDRVEAPKKLSNNIIKYIQKYNFTKLRKRMGYPVEVAGTGWDEATLRRVERKYKDWMTILYAYQDRISIIGFDMEIDFFWHNHMLDTISYVNFCKKVFGYYLHHNPYAGMPGEPVSMKDLAGYYENFQQLLEQYQKSKAA
ncbi:MAG: hypothetical protein HON43_04155 [Alphaproteobacteria bacterium]|jgi:hypothetical protein|nr:hypothetical protein [Alphaproteobacteria bacterium]MBT5389872.1 hypothetical protein [Alphaproteobacteria bacterium]